MTHHDVLGKYTLPWVEGAPLSAFQTPSKHKENGLVQQISLEKDNMISIHEVPHGIFEFKSLTSSPIVSLVIKDGNGDFKCPQLAKLHDIQEREKGRQDIMKLTLPGRNAQGGKLTCCSPLLQSPIQQGRFPWVSGPGSGAIWDQSSISDLVALNLPGNHIQIYFPQPDWVWQILAQEQTETLPFPNSLGNGRWDAFRWMGDSFIHYRTQWEVLTIAL
jgi:hypothetical protein